ncbi:hypothetical protein BC828DRAFT_384760 [Blastocladiella britannica]|nr:hypothetical protein BC828DRAFT_384760 [Blastocladiella britannica]
MAATSPSASPWRPPADAKQIALSTIGDTDLPHEHLLLRDPYRPATWLTYIAHKLGMVAMGSVPPSHLALLYERAVATIPGSYKLWKAYLDWSRARLRHLAPGSRARAAEVTRIWGCYHRALTVAMHKMPRLWTDFLEFAVANAPHRVPEIRAQFDAALCALAPGQHVRVWDLYLPWAEKVGGEVAVWVHKRYLQCNSSHAAAFTTLLLKQGHHAAAASYLLSAARGSFLASAAASAAAAAPAAAHPLFDKLVELAVSHPDAFASPEVADQVLEAAVRRHPQHCAKYWAARARARVQRGDLEGARAVFERSLRGVTTLRDFTVLFDAYVEHEEGVVKQQLKALARIKRRVAKNASTEDPTTAAAEAAAAAQREVDLRLARLDALVQSRPRLVNDVELRGNPHACAKWVVRATTLVPENRAVAEFERALRTIHPKHATGGLEQVYAAYARWHEDHNDPDAARKVWERAVRIEYKAVPELVGAWTGYAEFELRRGGVQRARDVMGRACSVPARGAASVDYRDHKLSVQRRLFKSTPLWSFYIDLEECFGTRATVAATYDHMIHLKLATPQVIANYALYLESQRYFEDSFKVYERGIAAFGYPVAAELWTVYIAKFMHRYGLEVDPKAPVAPSNEDDQALVSLEIADAGTTSSSATVTDVVAKSVHMERLRDLYEAALGAPNLPTGEYRRSLYVGYFAAELAHGQARRAMRVLDRACAHPTQAVDTVHRKPLVDMAAHVASAAFGLLAARAVYERALRHLPDRAAAQTCLAFAALELRAGDVPRARAVFAHGAPLAGDPTVTSGGAKQGQHWYWNAWRAFEVQYGNEESFKDMLRVRRAVAAQLNTDENYVRAVVATEMAKRQAAKDREAAAAAAAVVIADASTVFVRSTQDAAGTGVAVDEGELDLDMGDDEDVEDQDGGKSSSSAKANASTQIQQKAVPAGVFGRLAEKRTAASASLDPTEDGAKARLAKKRRV